MADKKNLCAQIDTALHARVRQEQERSGMTLSVNSKLLQHEGDYKNDR